MYTSKFTCLIVLIYCLCFSCKPNTKNEVVSTVKAHSIPEEAPKGEDDKTQKDTIANVDEVLPTYLVTARNGLSVRVNPSVKAEKTNLLPYGTKVTIIKKTDIPLTVNENGFKIEGHWVKIKNDSINTESYVFDGYLKTIKKIEKITESLYGKADKWEDFYGVYAFNKSVVGIVIIDEEENELNFDDTAEDYQNDLLEYKNNKYALYKDTFVKLFKNKKVTKKNNHHLDGNFYIYCTKKIVKVKVIDVLFHVNECSQVFTLLKLNHKLFNDATGKPVFASKRKIDNFVYGNFKKENTHYNHVQDITYFWRDCGFIEDNGHISIFAKSKNSFFGYRDDNNYSDDKDIEPYRSIVFIKNNQIYFEFSTGLDLFGCPCL